MGDMKIGIVGCGGRMGRMLVKQVTQTEGCKICGGTEPASSAFIGNDLGTLAGLDPLDVVVTDSAADLFDLADAVIDFTSPSASIAHAKLAAKSGKIHVIGTTGLSNEEQQEITTAGQNAVIVQGANMSLGVNLLAQLTKKVAAILDEDFDIEILEMHHHHKVDAPSGTALLLGKAAADGREVDHDTVAVISVMRCCAAEMSLETTRLCSQPKMKSLRLHTKRAIARSLPVVRLKPLFGQETNPLVIMT